MQLKSPSAIYERKPDSSWTCLNKMMDTEGRLKDEHILKPSAAPQGIRY